MRANVLAFVFCLLLMPVAQAAPVSAPLSPGEPLRPGAAVGVFLPLIRSAKPDAHLLVSALYYDGLVTNEPDEAFQLYNAGEAEVGLEGWRVSDGTRSAAFPAGMMLAPGAALWCTRDASAFASVFGHPAGCEYAADADPAVPNLTGDALRFANTGGRILLEDPGGALRDALVYEGSSPPAVGWQGPALYPYRPTTAFPSEGQILYRKLRPEDGRPVADTDSMADWAADPGDGQDGRRVRYPGWDLEHLFFPRGCTANAWLQVIVSPDHANDALRGLLNGAKTSIRFEGYSLESVSVAETLAARAAAGVDVTLLLDGAPPGGVSDAQRWAVQQISDAGGRVYYFRSDAATGIRKRYAYQHGKFWLLDDRQALVGTENPSPESFPADDKSDGTLGRRGVYLATDAPCVADAVREVMALDIAPAEHRDIWAWVASDPGLGAPPPGYAPPAETNGTYYEPIKPHPMTESGPHTFQVITSPEHALRAGDGLLGLAARAGVGDTLLIEQLQEPLYWGPETGSVTTDPNPRLDAYIEAARRGARVRVLLDGFFDDLSSPRSNLRTVEYLNAMAQAEGLDLEARRGNPTGAGIHNKMILAEIGGKGWVMAGSLNGGEASAKLNRELSLLVSSDAAAAYLADLFWHDWGAP